jgi:hypothetical protein
MRSDAMTIRAARSADTAALRRLAASISRRRCQMLRQGGDVGAVGALLRRLASAPVAA